MNVSLVNKLLEEEKISGLKLLSVAGIEEEVDEIDFKRSSINILFVTKPEYKVINLEHIIRINTVEYVDWDTVNNMFK